MLRRAPRLPCVTSTLWETALATMALHSVEHPLEVAARQPQILGYNWLAQTEMANFVMLRRCLPQLSPGEVFERFASTAHDSLDRLAARLLFLTRRGSAVTVVPTWQWGGRRANCVSVWGVRRAASDERFAALCGASLEAFLPFKQGLAGAPAWRQLLREAEAEAARLAVQLPHGSASLCGGGRGRRRVRPQRGTPAAGADESATALDRL